MPAFSKGLETVLHTALELANVRKHEFATLEHLLLALTEDQDAKAVIDACNVDMKLLRDNLTSYIDNDLSGLVMDTDEDCSLRQVFNELSSVQLFMFSLPGGMRLQVPMFWWLFLPREKAMRPTSCKSRI